MLPRDPRVVPAAPWSTLAALTFALATAVAVRGGPSTPPHATRVAIRIDCSEEARCTLAESLALDVWSEHRGPGIPLDVVVADDMLATLTRAGVSWQLIDPDIDATAAAEAVRLHDASTADSGDWFGEFRDYGAITKHMEQLAAMAPGRVQLEKIGNSIEGRPLWAMRIGGSAPGATPMLINGTQHAREWIAAMVTTCVADRLVRGYDTNPVIHEFVDNTELWVVPVVNPDGYQHSWGSNRYWRKNRRGNHGVDLNRNFSVAWGGRGSSNLERSETYRGKTAFSEPETRALRDLAVREQVKVAIDFHAYGQLILHPWNYTAAPATDRAKFAAVGDRMASAMFAPYQTRYTLQSGAELYAAAGTMSDWTYGEVGALSFTIELRPKGPGGRGGFVIPPEQIKPTCDEGLAAVLALRASK